MRNVNRSDWFCVEMLRIQDDKVGACTCRIHNKPHEPTPILSFRVAAWHEHELGWQAAGTEIV